MSTFLERRRFNEAYTHTIHKTLIQESIKQVKQVYLSTDKITQEEFTELKKVTEINSAKYIFRITKWYVESDRELDLSAVPGVIEWFDKNYTNLEKNDIARYNDFDELVGVMNAREVEKASYDMTDVNVIFEDEDVLFCQPLSNIATNNLSSDMKWCTSPKESMMWLEYSVEDKCKFMYWFDKTINGKMGKFCTEYTPDGNTRSFDLENNTEDNDGWDTGNEKTVLDAFPEKYYGRMKAIKWKDLEMPRAGDELAEEILHMMNGTDMTASEGMRLADNYVKFCEFYEIDPSDKLSEMKDIVRPRSVSSPQMAASYAHLIMGERWPEKESLILGNAFAAADYAVYVIKGRWPEAEKIIMTSPTASVEYAAKALKNRWPEAEKIIKTNHIAQMEYDSVFGES